LISLADSFYSSRTEAGDIVTDEIIEGFNKQRYIGEVVHYIEYIDDRWKDSLPSRPVTEPIPPNVPAARFVVYGIGDNTAPHHRFES
jgi:hypothetical protein